MGACRPPFGALRMAVRGLPHAVHPGGRSPREAWTQGSGMRRHPSDRALAVLHGVGANSSLDMLIATDVLKVG